MSSHSQRVEPMTLLQTKSHRPRLSGDLTPCTRLVERLNRGLDRASRRDHRLRPGRVRLNYRTSLVAERLRPAGCLAIGV
jgi:hypothetical protein